jgi:elongation factor Ts
VADIKLLKKLREETGISIADIRTALDENDDDEKKALAWLKKKGLEKAEKKAERETAQGLVESYVHQNGKIGSVVVLLCETDFVARTEDFKHLAHELAMQVASMNPKDEKELLNQDYIREPGVKISDLVKQTIAKLGENITIKTIQRFEV